MLLIFIATTVAVLAAVVCGRLASAPTPQPGKAAPLSWSVKSTAGLYLGVLAIAEGYLGSAFEEYGVFVLALAVMGPLAAAAWEQRIREIRPYRPHPPSALRRQETRDRTDPDVPEADPVPMVLQH